MSNHLAIATVTATLQALLQAELNKASGIGTPKVEAGRPPQAAITESRVNLFLYQVTSNGALRNADLPSRDDHGKLTDKPLAALDLHYLLSFYGAEATLVPQQLLALVVRALHTQPQLTRKNIRDTVQALANQFLKESNLADQVELVRFSPLPLSLEELSKLWTAFYQTPYALSVAYQACVVLIDSDRAAQPPLPVRDRGLLVTTIQQPSLEEARSDERTPEGYFKPLEAGSKLLLAGRRLRGEVTRVRLMGQLVTPQPDEVSDTQITLTLAEPPLANNALRAGVHGAQVVHQYMLGQPPLPHAGVESGVVPFILHPRVVNPTVGAADNTGKRTVTVGFDPKVRQGQRVVLLLNQKGGADARMISAPTLNADTATLDFDVVGLAQDDYLVRVQVDGAESLLTPDPATPNDKRLALPRVTVQ